MKDGQVVPGVPATVPRGRVVELLEALGFDLQDVKSLEFHREAIFAEVYADLRPGESDYLSGARRTIRFTHDREGVAMHRICIPVHDEE